MILIKPSYQILTPIDGDAMLVRLEAAGRTCYKSEEKITPGSAAKFIKAILDRAPPHESVIEHEFLSVRFICDRGVSHELVRHRLASFSQESTRYCDYTKGELTFVIPPWVQVEPGEYLHESSVKTVTSFEDAAWCIAIENAEGSYRNLRRRGWKPEQARSVLPNSLKTEVVMTANLREWRHVFNLRTARAAHPQMRELMIPLLQELQQRIPVMFDDIHP